MGKAKRESRFYDTRDPDGPTLLDSYNTPHGVLQPGDHVVYENPQLGPAGMEGEHVITELIDIGPPGEEPALISAILDEGVYEVQADNLRKAANAVAENPASWGEAEKIIAVALAEAEEARQQQIAGWSTPKRVAEALREAGLLIGGA
jgi:hypothetical protein